MLVLEEAKIFLNIDYDDYDAELQEKIDESVVDIYTSTGAELDQVMENGSTYLQKLYKLVQKMIIRDYFEEKTTVNMALIAQYLKLEGLYRKESKTWQVTQ